MTQALSTPLSLPYLIKSTPHIETGEYEFELYGYTDVNAGEKISEEIYLIYANTSSNYADGFILSTRRSTGATIEFGTEENPLPIELLHQMKTPRGLSYFETDEKNNVNAYYILRA